MQLIKEITKVIDNFLHEKGIYGVDCDDLEHKIAETINGKKCRITTCVGGADGILEVKNGELYIKSDKLDSYFRRILHGIIEEYALSEKVYLSWNTKQIIDACIIQSTGKTGEILKKPVHTKGE